MGKGFLTVTVHTAFDGLPVQGATVKIHNDEGLLYQTVTNQNGYTDMFEIIAPDKELTLSPSTARDGYSTCDVDISKEGFNTLHVYGVQIVDTIESVLPVELHPNLAVIPNNGFYNFIPATGGNNPAIGVNNPATGANNPAIGTNNPAIGANNLATTGGLSQNSNSTNNQQAITTSTQQGMLNRIHDDEELYISPFSAIMPTVQMQIGSNAQLLKEVFIPDYITVHLGIPTNTAARNVRVKFTDYIKNVASSEIYPTWPTSALYANIYAIITFAINRVFTEWYPSRGLNFDITNSTAYDQFFVEGRNIFANISQIVDNIFNVYARRRGFANPFFTQYCNGTTSTCSGLSQWGSVDLAERGYTPLQILHYYYPRDLELVGTDNIRGIVHSYPGTPLQNGSSGINVLRIQNFLNRIRTNFPLIPIISNPDGYFGAETEAAVRSFQRTFGLTSDGIVGKATWNKITFIYVGIIKLAELNSEGIRIGIDRNPPNVTISQGSRGENVILLQFIINYIAEFYSSIPTVIQDGQFANATKNAVIEFQKVFGLTPDGIVGGGTWNKLYSVYWGIKDNTVIPPQPAPSPELAPPYPGTPLRRGSRGNDVRLMQTYLNTIRNVYTTIPQVVADGIFGMATEAAVIAFQRAFLLSPDGIIGKITWDKIVEMFLLVTGSASVSTAYPGAPLSIGSTGNAVRLMQTFLSELRTVYPSIPPVVVDGIFGPITRNAVVAFQNLFALTPDGVIGPLTWEGIVYRRNLHFGG